MGYSIEYQGRSLGTLHFGRRDASGHHEVILVMEGLGALETLLKLGPKEKISISGIEKSYEEFRQGWLGKVETIYTSPQTYLNHAFSPASIPQVRR